jgi:drug/metabolite transporter (DMT)-like permease
MADAKSRKIVYVALTLVAFLYGSGFVVAKFGLRYESPKQFLAGQFVFAALGQVLWTLARGRYGRLRIPRSVILLVVALGLVGQNLLMGSTFFGLTRTTATNAALLYGFSPVMIGLIAAKALHEPFGRTKQLGALAGLFGVVLIITQGDPSSIKLSGTMLGNLIIFGGAVYWAIYTVITRPLTHRIPAEVLTFYLLVLSAIAPTIWYWVTEDRFPLAGLPAAGLAAAAFMGIGTMTLAMNLWNWGLERIEASKVGVFSYLEPVFTALVAAAFLREHLTLATNCGALLVFGGIFLSTRGKKGPTDL